MTVAAKSESELLVSWQPPEKLKQNGQLAGYKIFVLENGRSSSEEMEHKVDASRRKFRVTNLKTYTSYKVEVLAFTSVGDGPRSAPIMNRTEESGT